MRSLGVHHGGNELQIVIANAAIDRQSVIVALNRAHEVAAGVGGCVVIGARAVR